MKPEPEKCGTEDIANFLATIEIYHVHELEAHAVTGWLTAVARQQPYGTVIAAVGWPISSPEPPQGRTVLHRFGYRHGSPEWGCWATADGQADEFMTVGQLRGKVVNLGSKDGLVIERGLVVSTSNREGTITVLGGSHGRAYRDEDPRTTVEPITLNCHDIARGCIWV